jgi:putative spermidine/putrescine transport system ATP-binding protein
MTADIEIRHVTVAYGRNRVVHGIDLSVEKGQFVSLLGPSGCGKTTMLRMIAGLQEPSSGDIFIKGRRVNDIPVHQRNIGLVFQNHALFPHKSVFNNIAFGLKYRNVQRAEIARRVKRALEIVRLPEAGERLPRELSGGQQQRIAVARAIVIEPDVLLFDEPLSALDANLREEMRVELKRIQHTLGITTIFVTHDQSEALSMSDRVVLMRDGRIEQLGTPAELYNEPRTDFAARFFGYVNEFDGENLGADGDARVVRIGPSATVRVAKALSQEKRVKLLLRAEKVRVTEGDAREKGTSSVEGVITGSDYFGMLVRYAVNVAGTQVTVTQPLIGNTFQDGARVRLHIPDNAWISI